MRFHLLGLPNAPVSPDYSLDGFAVATHRFARMMIHLGHTVFLYGAEGSDESVCTEFIPIISERVRMALLGTCEYQHALMDERYPLWQTSNARAAAEVSLRKEPRDFLLTIGGCSQKGVFDFNTDLMGVEYSIGYSGSFADHRVFESYAWMHETYGRMNFHDGRYYDTVIPMFFDPADFPQAQKPDDYFLFVGRLIERKGIGIACQAATAAGVKLKIIGHGGDAKLITGDHEYLGAVDWKTRNDLMAKARAVVLPTIYVEPFNCAAVEAQMCGTPVISTGWGGFTETVEHTKTGFHCHLLSDFVSAMRTADSLDRSYIRTRAHDKYSMWKIVHDYQRYFDRLQTRWGAGWAAL